MQCAQRPLLSAASSSSAPAIDRLCIHFDSSSNSCASQGSIRQQIATISSTLGPLCRPSSMLKDTELVYPVLVGTVAFPLGKKATDSASHRWTVYLRGVHNEDLSHIITRVQFDLHPTFNNHQRVVETQPFEVVEHGWGEFEFIVHITFTTDSGEEEAVMYHKLKLYEDGEPVGSKQDPKKPVVTETYEELVFSEPRLEFYNRIVNHQKVPLNPPSQLQPYFRPPSEAQELEAIRAMRAKVAQLSADLRRELGAIAIPQAPPHMAQMAPGSHLMSAGGVMPGMPGHAYGVS